MTETRSVTLHAGLQKTTRQATRHIVLQLRILWKGITCSAIGKDRTLKILDTLINILSDI